MARANWVSLGWSRRAVMSSLPKKVLVALAVAIAGFVVVVGITARRQGRSDAAAEIGQPPTALQLKYTNDADPIIASNGNVVDGINTQGELSEWCPFKGDGRDVTAPLRNQYLRGTNTRIVLSLSGQSYDQETALSKGGLWVYIGKLPAGDPCVVPFASFKYWSEEKIRSRAP